MWNEENRGWSITDHLLATQIEFTDKAARYAIAPYTRQQPRPFVYPRPRPKRTASKSWIREWATATKGVNN